MADKDTLPITVIGSLKKGLFMLKIKNLSPEMLSYAESVRDELEALTEELCGIPAPSHHEEKRAEFCRSWFEKNGCAAHIDDALNVICPAFDDGKCDLIVFSAHTDTVFPDLSPLPFSKDNTTFYSPSVGDDTACVAIMMLAARHFIKCGRTPKCGVLFVANSCEEGIGNLKGIRRIMEVYGNRVKAHFSFDSKYSALVNRCVGSHRYKIEIKTEGGHSFSDFGNKNAIHVAAKIINELYSIPIPHMDNSKTTYNVGIVEGGTSVNTIAQNCNFLYEYRSDNVDCLIHMKKEFENVIREFSKDYDISVITIGERPCMNGVDEKLLDEISRACKAVQEKYSGVPCELHSGSTDCNIPMSLGIPAVALGVFDGGGEHTREEYLIRDSLPKGMKIAMEIICSLLED